MSTHVVGETLSAKRIIDTLNDREAITGEQLSAIIDAGKRILTKTKKKTFHIFKNKDKGSVSSQVGNLKVFKKVEGNKIRYFFVKKASFNGKIINYTDTVITLVKSKLGFVLKRIGKVKKLIKSTKKFEVCIYEAASRAISSHKVYEGIVVAIAIPAIVFNTVAPTTLLTDNSALGINGTLFILSMLMFPLRNLLCTPSA